MRRCSLRFGTTTFSTFFGQHTNARRRAATNSFTMYCVAVAVWYGVWMAMPWTTMDYYFIRKYTRFERCAMLCCVVLCVRFSSYVCEFSAEHIIYIFALMEYIFLKWEANEYKPRNVECMRFMYFICDGGINSEGSRRNAAYISCSSFECVSARVITLCAQETERKEWSRSRSASKKSISDMS